jgi:hypothetical protein
MLYMGYSSLGDAQAALSYAFTLSVWFMKTYGDWAFEPNAYQPPAAGQNVTEDLGKIDDYEKKIQELQSQLKSMRQEKTSDAERDKRRAQSCKAAAALLDEAETRRQRCVQ